MRGAAEAIQAAKETLQFEDKRPFKVVSSTKILEDVYHTVIDMHNPERPVFQVIAQTGVYNTEDDGSSAGNSLLKAGSIYLFSKKPILANQEGISANVFAKRLD